MAELDIEWSIFAFWTSIFVLKLLLFTWYTGRWRVYYKIIHSNEDRIWFKGDKITLNPTGGGHPEVDRIRNAHLNNLEAIFLFCVIFPLWINTNPSIILVKLFTYIFVTSRFFYTFCIMYDYIYIPRYYIAISLFVNYSILIFTAGWNLLFYFT